ncbi:MAG: YdcF family protein [Spirochaetes bacterium]|jgi:uncharacterized SAM-binding protein YcdF (DUF218 family)|nr:YdcF family protein [Spirochaetota bacterium]
MKKLLAVLLTVIFLPPVYLAWRIYNFSSDPGGRGDVAVVLGAASWGSDPSPVFRERINHAVWLYKNGYVGKIIFTGARDSRNEPPESIVARNYAVMDKEIPEKDILLETRSRTTMQNLYFANEICRKNGLKKMLIVSDPLHMMRAMKIAGDFGMDAVQAPTPTSLYRSWFSKVGFLAREVYYYSSYCIMREFGDRKAALEDY